eukprot:12087780-Alexandrium_andersonii.AAC.1
MVVVVVIAQRLRAPVPSPHDGCFPSVTAREHHTLPMPIPCTLVSSYHSARRPCDCLRREG